MAEHVHLQGMIGHFIYVILDRHPMEMWKVDVLSYSFQCTVLKIHNK